MAVCWFCKRNTEHTVCSLVYPWGLLRQFLIWWKRCSWCWLSIVSVGVGVVVVVVGRCFCCRYLLFLLHLFTCHEYISVNGLWSENLTMNASCHPTQNYEIGEMSSRDFCLVAHQYVRLRPLPCTRCNDLSLVNGMDIDWTLAWMEFGATVVSHESWICVCVFPCLSCFSMTFLFLFSMSFFRKDLDVLCQLHDLRMKFDWLLDSDLLREVQRATESLREVRSKHVVNVAADAVPWVSAKAVPKKAEENRFEAMKDLN